MKKVVLNISHLNANGKGKEVNDLGLSDFRVPAATFWAADKILYIRRNRCRVLKQRA